MSKRSPDDERLLNCDGSADVVNRGAGHGAAGGAAGPKPKIRRKRAVHVCARCKDLKLKCDLNEPCSACVRAKVESRCVYRPWRGEDPPENGAIQSTNASLFARVQQLEQQLHRMSPQSSASPNGASSDEWTDIISTLPSIDRCKALLEAFYLFDTMFRTTHQPSFRRRADQLLASLPNVPPDDAPVLAKMVLAMYIGGQNSTTTGTTEGTFTHLDNVYRRVMTYLERRAESHPHIVNLDYVSALHINVYRYMHGSESSIKLAWISIGRAVNAALLLRLDKEPMELDPMMSLFEAEMRRRLWFVISISEKILAEQMGLAQTLRHVNSTVLPPTIVADEQLENPYPSPSSPGSIPEWSYITTKIRALSLFSSIHTMKRENPQAFTYDKIVETYEMLEDFRASWPDHLRVVSRDGPTSPEEPPWVFAQACISNIGLDHGILKLLRSALLSTDLAIQAYALPISIAAAKRLIDTAQGYITHLLFRWTEGLSLNLWTFGNKIFQAALIISYSIFSDRSSVPQKQHDRLQSLDTAIGALGVMTKEIRSCGMNDKALNVLRFLRNKIATGNMNFGPNYDGVVFDPYTGDKVELLHQASPDVSEFLQTPLTSAGGGAEPGEFNFGDLLDWDNWEALLAVPST